MAAKVAFSRSSEPVEVDEAPGIWWRTAAINHQGPHLYTNFDVEIPLLFQVRLSGEARVLNQNRDSSYVG